MQVVFMRINPTIAEGLPGYTPEYEAMPFIEDPAVCQHNMMVCEWCIRNHWEEHDFLSATPTTLNLTMPGNLPAQHPVGI